MHVINFIYDQHENNLIISLYTSGRTLYPKHHVKDERNPVKIVNLFTKVMVMTHNLLSANKILKLISAYRLDNTKIVSSYDMIYTPYLLIVISYGLRN